MKSHIAIKAKGKFLAQREDASLSIEFQNPMWNDTEMFSYPVDLPFEGNHHLFQNVENPSSDI